MAQVTTESRIRRKDFAMEPPEIPRNLANGFEEGLDVTVLGMCSGSGLNKLDCALIRYRQASPSATLHMEMLQFSEIALSATVRNPILNLLREVQNKPALVPRLNTLLGLMFSRGIKTFCQNYDIIPASIDLIGTHIPSLRRFRLPETDNPNTHILGWNAVIAVETGITVVFDVAILENGVARSHMSSIAYVDKLILRHPTKFRACLNIFELSNISFIPALGEESNDTILSRDCGPGSLLIDYAMRYCTSNDYNEDHDGKFAARGKVNQSVVDRFLGAHDYLHVAPSLSIAREMFGDHEAQRLIDECLFLNMSDVDIVATITRVTAQNIVKQYHKLLQLFFPSGQNVDELFICGPGARNSNIIDYLEAELPESVITKPLDDIGIRGDANEAVCYAHLAIEAVLGQATRPSAPSTPTSTKVDDNTIRGRLVRGKNWDKLLERVLQFSQGKPLHITKDVRVAGNSITAINGIGL